MELLTLSAAAERYPCFTAKRLRALIREGALPAYRPGHKWLHVRPADLEQFLERCRVPSGRRRPAEPTRVAAGEP